MANSPYQHTHVIQPDAWDAITERTKAGAGGVSAATATTSIIRRYVAILADEADTLRELFSDDEIDVIAAILRRPMAPGDDIISMLKVQANRMRQSEQMQSLISRVTGLHIAGRIALIDMAERRLLEQEADDRLHVTAGTVHGKRSSD